MTERKRPLPEIGQVWVPVSSPTDRYLVMDIHEGKDNDLAFDLYHLRGSTNYQARFCRRHSVGRRWWDTRRRQVRMEEPTEDEQVRFALIAMGIFDD